MDPMIGSALISGGSSLLGGLMGSKGTSRKRERDSISIQYEEARKHHPLYIDTVLNTAKSKGIHPLVALGMQPQNMAQASMVGDTGSDVGSALAAAGQDVSRAMSAYQSREQREQAATLATLSVERAGLENELLRSQIAGQRAQLAPALANLANNGVEIIPKEVVANDGTIEKGTRAISQRFQFLDSPIYGMSEDFANAGNDDGPLTWANQIGTGIQMGGALLGYPVRKGWRALKKSVRNARSKSKTYR